MSVGDVRGLPVTVNDKVIVEMVRYPDSFQSGEAVILEVLGASKNPAVDTLAVMYQFGLVDEYPEAAVDQARAIADHFSETITDDRTDLTKVPTLTIDPFDARDFDDAISLSKNEAGHWELMVHIADVSHFVPAVHRSIRRHNGAGRVSICRTRSSRCSRDHQQPSGQLATRSRASGENGLHRDDVGGNSRLFEDFHSAIRNAQRLNYEQVDQFLADREPWRSRLTPAIFDLLADMHNLAMTLRRRRMEGGSIELTLPEVKIDLDRSGKVKGAHLVHHTESHQTIEELMLAANQAVATYLDDLEIPFLRRVHAPPQRIKLKRLYEFVRGLGIECNDLQDRFEIQRVVNAVRGQNTEQAVNYAVLKSMSKAVYQPQVERHYALDMTHYCHFTSPIRRYPDLVIHRIIQKLIDGQNAKEPLAMLGFLGQHCSDREVNAEQAERELIRVKLLHFMSRHVGKEFEGILTAVNPEDLNVRLHEVPVDGTIVVQALPSDRYRFDRETHTLEGFRSGNRFRLGDSVRIRVERVDLARRQLFFAYLSHQHHATSNPLSPPAKKKRKRKESSSDKSRTPSSRRGSTNRNEDSTRKRRSQSKRKRKP